METPSSSAVHHEDDISFDGIPDFTITPSIDYITLSVIHAKYFKIICNLMYINNFVLVSDVPLIEGNFNKKRGYKDKYSTVEILYDYQYNGESFPQMMIKIHDVTQGILNLFVSFFNRFAINYKIKQIEYTFDFHTEAPFTLQNILDDTLFLKYQKLPSRKMDNTYYTTQRRATKSTRTYVKEIDGENVVRLELIINRKIIKKLGLELSVESLNSINFSKYFIFKHIDVIKVKKHLKWRQRHNIAKAYSRSRLSGGLLKKTIENLVDSIITDETQLMEQVEGLKKRIIGITGYSRFITEHVSLMERFNKEVSGKSFIPAVKKKYKIPKTS